MANGDGLSRLTSKLRFSFRPTQAKMPQKGLWEEPE
jgi:hypothetical protein